MIVSGEAIDAALEAFWANEDKPQMTAMKRALEAAAPYLLEKAWDQGYDSYRTPNPYRAALDNR